jgi:hypothetical protein
MRIPVPDATVWKTLSADMPYASRMDEGGPWWCWTRSLRYVERGFVVILSPRLKDNFINLPAKSQDLFSFNTLQAKLSVLNCPCTSARIISSSLSQSLYTSRIGQPRIPPPSFSEPALGPLRARAVSDVSLSHGSLPRVGTWRVSDLFAIVRINTLPFNYVHLEIPSC